LIYQHATSSRDREIADALGARIAREVGAMWPTSGPAGVSGLDGESSRTAESGSD